MRAVVLAAPLLTIVVAVLVRAWWLAAIGLVAVLVVYGSWLLAQDD